MECEVSSTQKTYNGTGNRSPTATNGTSTTKVGIGSSSPVVVAKTGSGKSQLHVDFIEQHGEVKEKREKYLTAKYGSHQMFVGNNWN